MNIHRSGVPALIFGLASVLSILILTPPSRGLAPRHDREREGQAESVRERGLNSSPGILEHGRSEGTVREEGNAWDYFEWWYGTRAYPNELIPKSAFYRAWSAAQTATPQTLSGRSPTWSSIGPTNIGGRMLALAIDPLDPNTVWAGAASGGLWKSVTAGEGAAAWDRIETGFPTLSVSAIAIDSSNPDNMYIGTGEIGRYSKGQVGTPGARASYGIGVLKSTDRGVTWSESGLNWTMDQQRTIQALRIDPTDPATLWAASSEGLYKSTDRGDTWSLMHASLMAMDVVIDPQDPNKIFVSHGQLLGTVDPGIYRSIDGGTTWTLLGGGLPSTNFGRTPLAIVHPTPSGAATVYAGVSNASTRVITGLYRSTNDGTSWTRVSSVNWASSQAWYDNVIGVSPYNTSLVYCGGLDWYRSTTGGTSLNQLSVWYDYYDGTIPPGGDEGSPDYVHADQHALAFDPVDQAVMYVGCDGGVFKSTDSGLTWSGKNGGLVTTQIYAGFAGGFATSGLAVGGLQDNGTIKYTGDPAWAKIFGGDGGWCAIDPTDEDVIYEEYVYLDMYKSYDGGLNWTEIHSEGTSTTNNFISPFVISESAPNILYAGGLGVEKTTNGGSSWFYPDGNSNWNGTPMAIIGVSYTSPDTVLAATGSSATGAVVQIKRSVNGGVSWTDVTAGLPVRYPTHFAFDRHDSRTVWLSFSGYGTPHVFRSTDAGLTWADRTGDLPDIPVQSVVLDPDSTNWAYVGTDLGVFRTTDAGGSWQSYGDGMPLAMICDLVVHPSDRKMRAATFGNGVYESNMEDPTGTSSVDASGSGDTGSSGRCAVLLGAGSRPNPFRGETAVGFNLARGAQIKCGVYDAAGRCLRVLSDGPRPAGHAEIRWDGRGEANSKLAAGTYFVRVTAGTESRTEKVVLLP